MEQKIRYLTFDELCEERLAHIRQASKELVETGQVTAARPVLEELICFLLTFIESHVGWQTAEQVFFCVFLKCNKMYSDSTKFGGLSMPSPLPFGVGKKASWPTGPAL